MLRLIGLLLALILAAPAAAEPQVGEPAPRLDVPLVDGKVLRARQWDGKVVLTVYWALWCPTCMRELPELQKLYETYRGRGFEILAVSLDEDPRDVADFWELKGFSFPVAMRADPLKQAWGRVSGTPTLYLADRKGVVRIKRVGAVPYEELEAQLKRLL